ncbi:MAG: response regulator [Lachnospiraceae bacterium]|nr:response regulator [Lachnospiraceae bacterium]
MGTVGKNIVIAAFQYSVVVRGIESRLKGLGYTVEVISENFESLKARANWANLYVVYLPDDILDDQAGIGALHKRMEMMTQGEANLLFVGDSRYRQSLISALPVMIEFEWVNKPVEMESFFGIVEKLANTKRVKTAKKRILVVDDDPYFAKMISEWIRDLYRTDIVTSGAQAMSFLQRVREDEPVDLILLDYEMPVADGPQVLQMLRKEPKCADIPVIFLTGLDTKEAVSRVMALKPDGYVLKSTSKADILSYLQKKLK